MCGGGLVLLRPLRPQHAHSQISDIGSGIFPFSLGGVLCNMQYTLAPLLVRIWIRIRRAELNRIPFGFGFGERRGAIRIRISIR